MNTLSLLLSFSSPCRWFEMFLMTFFFHIFIINFLQRTLLATDDFNSYRWLYFLQITLLPTDDFSFFFGHIFFYDFVLIFHEMFLLTFPKDNGLLLFWESLRCTFLTEISQLRWRINNQPLSYVVILHSTYSSHIIIVSTDYNYIIIVIYKVILLALNMFLFLCYKCYFIMASNTYLKT